MSLQVQDIGLIGGYDKQQFLQFNPQDVANWYLTESKTGKRPVVMYPVAGRQHIEFLENNKLVFPTEPRGLFSGLNYAYVVVGSEIYRIDEYYNTIDISAGAVTTVSGNVYFARVVNATTSFACFSDAQNIYIYQEDTETFTTVTDALAPSNPTFLAAFGERLFAADLDSNQVYYSKVGLGGNLYNPATCFNNGGFISVRDIVRQLGVLHNTLYVFQDFTTAIWSFIPSRLPNGTLVPFKQSSSQEWDYGIADPLTLDIDFGRMTFLAKNKNGAVQVMVSAGGTPQDLNTKAIDLLFRRDALNNNQSPFLRMTSNGFLYQEDDTIFYRISTSSYEDFQDNDIDTSSHALEYNFNTGQWHRVIEYNGERNRINKHIFFPDRHLVTVLGEGTIYEMSTQFYTNEELVDGSYVAYPFRYEAVSPIISGADYAEYETEYVEIDMVFGTGFPYLDTAFADTTFVITEDEEFVVTEDGTSDDPVFVITEDSDVPALDETFYRELYKPHVELYYSDDGGITYQPADVREFSQQGIYSWRMRWYQLGSWRNRNYKLICVSPVPMVILGAVQAYRRISGGAN